MITFLRNLIEQELESCLARTPININDNPLDVISNNLRVSDHASKVSYKNALQICYARDLQEFDSHTPLVGCAPKEIVFRAATVRMNNFFLSEMNNLAARESKAAERFIERLKSEEIDHGFLRYVDGRWCYTENLLARSLV